MGRVERIFVDESRVAAPGPDVAEREYVFGRFVELIDLGGGNTVSVQNLTEGFATVDDLLFEPVVVGGYKRLGSMISSEFSSASVAVRPHPAKKSRPANNATAGFSCLIMLIIKV